MSFNFSGLTNIMPSVNTSLGKLRYTVNVIQGFSLKNLFNGTFPHKKSSGAKIKGYLIDSKTKESLKFQFNPQSMEYSRSVNFAEVLSPGMQYPLTYFVNGGSESFDLELFEYDRPTTGKIQKDIDFIEKLMPKKTNVQGLFINPNTVIYAYGGYIAKCVVTGFKKHIDEYAESGEPYMAHLTISLKVVDVPLEGNGNTWRYGNNSSRR